MEGCNKVEPHPPRTIDSLMSETNANKLPVSGSVRPLVVNQDLVDEILKLAKASHWGLDMAKASLSLDQYAEKNIDALSLLLVNGWDGKYDLVSLFSAAIRVVNAKAQNAQAERPATTKL